MPFFQSQGLIIITTLMFIYSALISVAPNYTWVLILRLIAGVCVVGVQSSFILYLGEITPSSFRALFVLGQVVSMVALKGHHKYILTPILAPIFTSCPESQTQREYVWFFFQQWSVAHSPPCTLFNVRSEIGASIGARLCARQRATKLLFKKKITPEWVHDGPSREYWQRNWRQYICDVPFKATIGKTSRPLTLTSINGEYIFAILISETNLFSYLWGCFDKRKLEKKPAKYIS